MKTILHRLYFILDVDTVQMRTDNCTIEDVARQALDAGVRFIQLRAKHSSSAQLWRVAQPLSILCAGYCATLLINDRADVAITLGLNGIHRPSKGIPVDVLKKTFGAHFFVGVSCHTIEETQTAGRLGADFVTLSPFWPPRTKPDVTTISLKQLSVEHQIKPVFALGGITPQRAPQCIAAGAYGIAVMSGIALADSPFEAALDYLSVLE